MSRLAFYGGSFDPVHVGHLSIATALLKQFALDELVFVPAFHAPHKTARKPTSAYDRFAMLCLATQELENVSVSRIELEMPERPYSIETLSRLNEMHPNDQIFFVMGADSWQDVTTWRQWEKLLSITNHIVVTRPGVKIACDHVTDDIRARIVDMRQNGITVQDDHGSRRIFITDAVNIDISATEIRGNIRAGNPDWKEDTPGAVAKYIEKYQIYK
jgi:nicotinate-nucleotide adenylyltransferase